MSENFHKFLQFKSLRSVRHFFKKKKKEINTFILQVCIELLKTDTKNSYNAKIGFYSYMKK